VCRWDATRGLTFRGVEATLPAVGFLFLSNTVRISTRFFRAPGCPPFGFVFASPYLGRYHVIQAHNLRYATLNLFFTYCSELPGTEMRDKPTIQHATIFSKNRCGGHTSLHLSQICNQHLTSVGRTHISSSESAQSHIVLIWPEGQFCFPKDRQIFLLSHGTIVIDV